MSSRETLTRLATLPCRAKSTAPKMEVFAGSDSPPVRAGVSKTIICQLRGHDRYKRSIGLCRANAEDLSAAMVRAGMAWAFTRYSSDYIGEERAAISARLGVHAHDCMRAWDWRRARP